MFFAFDQRQFAEGMRRLGLLPSDMNQVYAIAGTGGFYRKSDAPKLHEMFARHRKELEEAIAADKAGDNFIYEMFLTELSNHEYGYTGDVHVVSVFDWSPSPNLYWMASVGQAFIHIPQRIHSAWLGVLVMSTSILQAVSYTHLDVYKRQAIF